jgi:O-6-methylguanine DNA methyltransferase
MISVYVKNVEGVWFGVALEEEKVFATTFASSQERTLKGLLESLPFDVPFERVNRDSAFAERVIGLLKDIYDGEEFPENVSLSMDHLSKHTQKVLRVASLIPLGYAASYGEIAKASGSSPRGVGRVMALNPFAPIVPCHRVVGSDFSLVGYGGGLDSKLKFLRRERKGFASKREIPVDGKKLMVFPVEFVLRKVDKG